MAESEDKKELGGLARSIDSLFSGVGESAPPGEEPEVPVPEDTDAPEAQGAVEAVATEGDSVWEAEDLASAEADAGGEPVAEQDWEALAQEPDPFDAVPEAAAPFEPEAAAPLELEAETPLEPEAAAPFEAEAVAPLELEAETPLEPEAADPFEPEAAVPAEPEAAAPWAPEPAVPAEPEADIGAERGTDPLAEVDADLPEEAVPARAGDEVEPSPLELAVESYLMGGGDAGRVGTLATQHLDAREVDPVAGAVERLVLGAGDPPDSRTMELASELLTPMVRSRLVQRLGREPDPARRRGYFRVCTALGEEMALAIRDEMAEATDLFVRRAYFDALVAMGDLSRPIIEAMANDDNRFLARNAVAILGEVGGPHAVELVVAALANTDPRVRREALLAMARLKVEDADELITGLLEDSEESVRLAAVVAAGELHVERALRQLIAALDGAYEAELVLPILHALGQIGDPGAVASIEKHAVRERFAKPRTEVRIAAYQALSHIGTPHARRLLNQAVTDKDPEVKTAVKELLHMR